ncbi:hypothetical protein [Methanobrevibacter sp.]
MSLENLYNHLKTLTSQWFYLKSEIVTLLNGKSDTNHTHNDATTSASGFMSSADKTKLNGIENQANKTVVDNSLMINSNNPVRNMAVATAINAVNANINNLNSTINNLDAGDIAYNNSTVEQQLITILQFIDNYSNIDLLQVVSELPIASSSTMNKLYLVANQSLGQENNYNIFITVLETGTYSWEKVDDADLQGFITKTQADGYYATKSHSHGNLTNTGTITTNGTFNSYLAIVDSNNKLSRATAIDVLDNIVQQLINYGA